MTNSKTPMNIHLHNYMKHKLPAAGRGERCSLLQRFSPQLAVTNIVGTNIAQKHNMSLFFLQNRSFPFKFLLNQNRIVSKLSTVARLTGLAMVETIRPSCRLRTGNGAQDIQQETRQRKCKNLGLCLVLEKFWILVLQHISLLFDK